MVRRRRKSKSGVGGSRMPSERQNRAVRKVLLDLVGEGPVELPQHNPDSRVGIARQQCSVQIDLVVWRSRKDRNRVAYTSAFESLAAVRARRGDEDRAG